jgi:uncharacterized protein (TIGR03083 family)
MTVYKGPVTTDSLHAPLSALHRSQDRLAGTVGSLTADQVTGPSYDDDWSIAQVLSHLGSGAEIFGMLLDAGLNGQDPPGPQHLQEVWDRWNGKSPQEQARDAVAANTAFLDRVDGLGPAERERWRLSVFGSEQDLAGLVRMRLGEHALHTWDIVVMLDARDSVPAEAVEQILQTLPGLAAYTGKPAGGQFSVHVTTENPARSFRLAAGPDGVTLAPAGPEPAAGDGTLRLPAEALVRLVYGRLDPEHTPAIESEHVDLDALRRVFPGF